MSSALTHFDTQGQAHMVDVSAKDVTHRVARASGVIRMLPATLALIRSGNAKKGDVIHLDFAPDAGTRVVVNGKPQGSAIAGDDFYTAVLRIWLGDKPADSDLKKGLVGG